MNRQNSLDERLSNLFPELFSIARPITTSDVPVIVAASMLSIYDSPILPIIREGTAPAGKENNEAKLFQAIGSLPIVRMVLEIQPSEYYKALWQPCTTRSIWIGSLGFQDTLEDLLRIYEATGFGDARVEAPTPPNTLITLSEVVSLFGLRKLRCSAEVNKVASRIVQVDPDALLLDALRSMSENRIRRLFLRGRQGEFISDRSVLGYLLSPKALKIVRDAPESWLDVKVSAIQSVKADVISANAKVEDVGSMVSPGRDVFVLSDGFHLLSKWDLVMKPWKMGLLNLAPALRHKESSSSA